MEPQLSGLTNWRFMGTHRELKHRADGVQPPRSSDRFPPRSPRRGPLTPRS